MGQLEQGVLDAGITGAHAALDHEHLTGPIHLEHGHAVEGAVGVVLGVGVHHVVRAQDDDDIGAGELGVDRVHLEQLLVGDVGFRQKHVHVARHAAGHGVDGVADLGAVGLEHLRQLAQGVLGLGHGKAVTGNEDDALGALEGHGALFRAAADDPAVAGFIATATHGGAATQGTTKEHAHQGAVHAVAHHLGEDQASGTDHGARHDQQLAAHHETSGGGSHTGIGVQQRDHHRHVRAADGQGHANAEQARGHHQQPEGGASGIAGEGEGADQGRNGDGDVHAMADLALGPTGGINPTLQLAHRHDGAAEGDRADKDRDHDGHQGHHVRLSGVVEGHGNGHQQRGHATAAVKEGDGLRHGGHRHSAGGDQTQQAAGGGTHGDPEPGHRRGG